MGQRVTMRLAAIEVAKAASEIGRSQRIAVLVRPSLTGLDGYVVGLAFATVVAVVRLFRLFPSAVGRPVATTVSRKMRHGHGRVLAFGTEASSPALHRHRYSTVAMAVYSRATNLVRRVDPSLGREQPSL